jgi:hypothetical protein
MHKLVLRTGFIIVKPTKITFYYDTLKGQKSHLSILTLNLKKNDLIKKEWQIDLIEEIQKRRFLLKWNGLELFYYDGYSSL